MIIYVDLEEAFFPRNKNGRMDGCQSFNRIFSLFKGELHRKMNLWSNYTFLPSQPLSEICFHDSRM